MAEGQGSPGRISSTLSQCLEFSTPASQASPSAGDLQLSKVRDGRKGDYINVTCGNKTGRLYLEKFAKSAKCKARIVDKCIYAEGKDYTPGEFESLGGKGRAKSWKKSIRHQGKPLSEYIKANLIWVQGNVEEMVTLSPVAKQPDHTGRTNTSIEPSSADDTGGSSTTHGGVNIDEIYQGLEQMLMAAVETMVKQACEQMKLLLLEEIAKIQTQVNKLQEQVTQIRSEKATPIPILPEPSSLNESTMGNNPISVQIDSLTAAVNNQQRAMEQQAKLLRRQNAVLVGLEETNERELTRKRVIDVIKTKMGVEEPRIESAFRLGRKHERNNTGRPILVRFQTTEGKEEVMRKKALLRGTQIYLNHDLTREQRKQQKELRDQRRKGNDKQTRNVPSSDMQAIPTDPLPSSSHDTTSVSHPSEQ